MSHAPIWFDETGFEYQGESDGVLRWYTPQDDGLGLYHYPIPPNIEADLHDVAELRAFFRRLVREAGMGVIEIDSVAIDGCAVVRTLFKAVQQPTGRTYLGSLIFPFRDFSFVLKVQCPGHGTTGMRDAVVLDKLVGLGETRLHAESGRMSGWLDDPYDPLDTGPMTRNKSERAQYDAQFPDHPLARARRVLDHLQRTVALDAVVKTQPPFVGAHASP